MLNSFQKSRSQSFEEALLNNFEEFFELIYHFGIGIILFPSLINALGGNYTFTSFDPSPNAAALGKKGQSFLSILGAGLGTPSN